MNMLQSALYFNRRRRVSRQLSQSVTPWSSSLTVKKGDYVMVAGTHLFRATEDGTTGATAPTAAVGNDGAVLWVPAYVQSLEPFLFSGVPTP